MYKEINLDKIGRNIKIQRAIKGWNQDELSSKSLVSKNTISNIEAGKNEPRLSNLIQFAKAFDIEVEVLIYG